MNLPLIAILVTVALSLAIISSSIITTLPFALAIGYLYWRSNGEE